MIRQIRSLSIVGLVAGLVALTGCGETTPPVAESPVPSPSVASPVATTTTAPSGPKVDINTASAEELKKLGWNFVKSYKHDEYITNRYKLDCMEIEFTYQDNKLITTDLTISELNCIPINYKQAILLTELIKV